MIAIKKSKHLLWRNIHEEHPIFLVKLEYGSDSAARWSFESLPVNIRNIIINKFPLLKSGILKNTPTEFLSALNLAIHREKFSLPLTAGASEDLFYFAMLDQYFSYATSIHTVSFLNFIIRTAGLNEAGIVNALNILEDNCEASAIDQSARASIREAEKRGIPWFRISAESADVQFGQGYLQERLRNTCSSNEKSLAHSYTRDKVATCNILNKVGLPVGKYALVANPEQAAHHANIIGFPVVIKPIDGGKGLDVIVGLNNAKDVYEQSKRIFSRWRHLIVQSYFPGDDHRLLVVEGKFIAAARREPASVIADGKSTIKQLIGYANSDPRRGRKFYRIMNYIIIDDELLRVIASQELNLSSIPPAGMKVKLRLTANISSGGTSVDVTDIIHPDNIILAERAARTLSLKVAGVDFLTTDISRSWKETGGGICEVNTSVGLRPHWIASPDRDVVAPIFNTIYKPGSNGRVPTAMITGSNGKTTTTRMLDHILREAGHVVGCATTDGITINGAGIFDRDAAGAGGAEIVLCDPDVTAASLETARGGIIRSGIYIDYCNVAALLNVTNDHIGIDGIETIQQLINLKRKVIDTARDKVILNAMDKACIDIARDFSVDKIILFSLDSSAESVKSHCDAGGTAVILKKDKKGTEKIVIIANGKATNVIAVDEVPATFCGIVRHNIDNALASAALAYGMGIPVKTIAKGLSEFTATPEDSPGRFNLIEDLPVKVLFEFGNNAEAIASSVKAIAHFKVKGQKICAISTPGNRLDNYMDDCAKEIAGHFDYYICFDRIEWRRNREPGETAARLANVLLKAGIDEDRVVQFITQEEAIKHIAEIAKEDDFVVIMGTVVRQSLPQIREAFASYTLT